VHEPSSAVRTPQGLWLTAACYALIALLPIPGYYFFRAQSSLPDEQWAGTTPFDQYLGVGLLYLGSAAACSYLLLKRRAEAVWPAAFVAVWVGLQAVSAVRRLLQGRPAEVGPWVEPLLFVVLGLLALYVRKLRRQGVLL